MVKNRKITYIINDNGCWINNSHARNQKGYPRITIKGKYLTMSRYLYQQKNGIIPEGLVIRHKCDTPACINLVHLELGTNKENMEDAVKRGRMVSGEKHRLAKLNKSKILHILSSSDGPRKLGREFSVAHTTIIRLRQRKIWKNLVNK